MLLTLRMRQVIRLVGMQREAQLAFVRSQVIPHQVRILGKVDRLECQFAQSLLPFAFRLLCRRDAATPEFRADAILTVHHDELFVLILFYYGKEMVVEDELIYQKGKLGGGGNGFLGGRKKN